MRTGALRPAGLLAVLLAFHLGASAEAQLDLPAKRKGATAEEPRPEVPKPAVRGELAPRDGGMDAPALDLPERAPADAGPSTEQAAASPPLDAARFVLEEVRREKSLNSSLALAGAGTLAGMGEAALAAAREELARSPARRGVPVDLVPFVLSARLLLAEGTSDDRERVAARMRAELPTRACEPLLLDLVARDPVLAGPEYLTAQLEHSVSAMRDAAFDVLRAQPSADLVPYLAPLLDSARGSTRVAAVDLAASSGDPAALPLLFAALGDRLASVAGRAAEHLATHPLDVGAELRRTALGAERPERQAAYATLALVQREDRTRETLFFDEDVPELLLALADARPIVAGAAAAALAGIGFRSARWSEPCWLDREVPHTLVRTATGDLFHADFSSLQAPGLARLALLAGQVLGRNGQAWQAWWVEHARGFRARRAVLPLAAGDEARLRLRLEAESGDGAILVLLGSAEAAAADAARAPEQPGTETLFLEDHEAALLVGELQAQGLFGVERLPGRRGEPSLAARRLVLSAGSGEKAFEVAPGIELPWFERSLEAVLGVADRNRWQVWYDREEHASAFEAWVLERDWWRDAPAPERARRLAERVLARLAALPVAERDAGVRLLAELYADGVARAADFQPLLRLLEQESMRRGAGSRRETLLELALIAAADASAGAGEHAEDVSRGIDSTLARQLLAVLVESESDLGGPEARRVVARALPALSLELAGDRDPLLRALAADSLGRLAAEDAKGAAPIDRLASLLADPALEVRVAAATALGAHRLEAGRAELVRAAREGAVPLRTASLRALALLAPPGDTLVRELALIALAEPETELQQAAVDALAELDDPESASILASLLSRGPASHYFPAARRGLARLGLAAEPELLRLLASGPGPVRREAALLLSEAGVARAASSLLTILTETPGDQRVARELAILTGVDLRADEDPVRSWWDWWDTVAHDDAIAWLLAAAERAGARAPDRAELAWPGTRAAALFLVDLMARASEPTLVERARRELSRLLGEELDQTDAGALDALRKRVESRWGG